VPVLELSQETSTLNVHFSAVIKTEMLGIPAVYDEIDPASTDDAINRRAILEIKRIGGAIEFRLRVGEYAGDRRLLGDEGLAEFVDS
jgi:hypothetical protein